nr:isoform 2 of probable inactive receptor kinase [Quercus suber]
MFIGLHPPEPTINFITLQFLIVRVSYTAYNENSVLFLALLDHHMFTVCQLCEKGRVIGLNLFNESISGSLHNSSLFSLQYLENLNLACNKLSASLIPSQFGNLTNLIYLNLSNAGFEGQIPIEISNLSRLVTLDLSINIFLSDSMLKIEKPYLATLVQNFGKLEELYLDAVNISAPGNEWCQALSSSAPNLRVLSMEHFQKVSSKFLHCRRFTYQMTNYFKGHCQMQLVILQCSLG